MIKSIFAFLKEEVIPYRPRGATHVQGQGQKPGGPHAQRAAAKRSYPTSEVRGSGREELPNAPGQGRQLGGPTPRPKSGGCAGAGRPRGAIPR